MCQSLRRACALALVLLLTACYLTPVADAQKKSKKEPLPPGTPILWQEPTDLESRDLFLGPGGKSWQPDLRQVTFVKQETGGFSTKYRVRDAQGREWVAKVGKEAQSETAAVRLVWAVGYVTEINYLVPRVTIEGKGTFENVRFEARPKHIKRLDEWKWTDNPFSGTKELRGLIVLMALLNNWDIKDSNNNVLLVRSDLTGRYEYHYIVSDLGATFGRTGNLPVVWRFTRSRNKPEDFGKEIFIEEVKGERVFFHYGGKHQDLFDDLRLEEARWIGQLLARLSDRQISDAFRAANYSAEEISMLTDAVRSRIRELVSLPGAQAPREASNH